MEVAELEKQVEEGRLKELKRRKEWLQKKLREQKAQEEVEEKSKGLEKGDKNGKRASINNGDNWEGLMSASQYSDEGEGDKEYGKLPPFSAIKSIFTEEQDRKRKQGGNRVDIRGDSESDQGDSGGDTDNSEEDRTTKKKKGKLQSGIFAKASNTWIVKQVLHAHAMVDADETDGHDITFDDLSFNMLVAGELEIVLSDISTEEKWMRLMVLKKLAYKSQYLQQSAILEQYAGFLRKVEKGKSKWGLETAMRELDETLHFRTFMSLTKGMERKQGGTESK